MYKKRLVLAEFSYLIELLFRYVCYLIAFALGFYILLHNDDGKEAAEGEEENNSPFKFIGVSMVKTFAMFVGELEFGDLGISSTVGYLFLLGQCNTDSDNAHKVIFNQSKYFQVFVAQACH